MQLTDSTTESILIRSYFPTDDRLIYLSDQGGNELTHLYVREEDGTLVIERVLEIAADRVEAGLDWLERNCAKIHWDKKKLTPGPKGTPQGYLPY